VCEAFVGKERKGMKSYWLAPLAIAAVAVGLSVSAAQSAPAMSTLDGLKTTAAEQNMTTDVRRHRRCHRVCHWSHGHRRCHWRCRHW
jgi:hypothetical protein